MASNKPPPLSPQAFRDRTGVSETVLARLTVYAERLVKWQSRINLVGAATLGDPWRRHMLDSAQVHAHLPPGARVVIDLGSGAGFPGMVLAIIGGVSVHLVESNRRKCVFLNEVNRLTGAGATVHNRRIEDLEPFAADAVTARACAPVNKLLPLAAPFVGAGGVCLFLKGRKAEEELTDSSKEWIMRISRIQSLSDSSGVILKLEGISRRNE